jgi:hypothetical protein
LVSVVDFEPKKSWVQAPNRPEKKNKKSKFYQAIRNQNQIFHGFNPESTTETSGLKFPRDFETPKLRVLQKTYEITPEVSVERKPEKFSKSRAKKNYSVPSCLIFEFWDFGRIMAVGHWTKSQNRDSWVFHHHHEISDP